MSLKDAAAAKPSIEDFALGASLGEGNFSRLSRATHRATGEQFALKAIDKPRVARLRARHPNIFNEINMEKAVLNALRHPNIVRLYQTFQDHANLYFLLELLEGGELLDQLLRDGRQMPLDEQLARFYLADVVNAVEYLHSHGFLHRDLKPENMVVDAKDGHLKLVDFGTAKNLTDPTLNGPNFVGTPEYMPPEVIANQEATSSSDLWAVGCILFQLLTGETPFSGGSAYLTFLNVQQGRVEVPAFVSDAARDLIMRLLVQDPTARLTIDQVKAHDFFSGVDFDNHMAASRPQTQFAGGDTLMTLVKDLEQFEKLRKRGRHRLKLDGEPLQIRVQTLTASDTSLVMHLLKRKQLLHLPGIYPRFFASTAIGRCRYATRRQFVGLSHELQNEWNESFAFMQLAGPQLGRQAALDEQDGQGGSSWSHEAAAFRQAIAAINRKTPAFVAIIGHFVHASPGQRFHNEQVAAFQTLVDGIDPEVCLVLVPGPEVVATDAGSLADYEARFGDSWFSFWYGGMKFIVLNSSIFAHSKRFEREAKQQEEWFAKEIENGKLCARGTAVFSFHALDGADDASANNECGTDVLAKDTREKLLDTTRTGQVCLITSAGATDSISSSISSVPRANSDKMDEFKCDLVRCQAPWDAAHSSVVVAKVTQHSVILDTFKPEPLVPPSIASTLEPSSVKLSDVPETPHEETTTTTLAAEVAPLSLS